MSDYEELDSFTENIVKRTLERQRILNNDNEFDDSLTLRSNVSKTSLKSKTDLRVENSVETNTQIETAFKLSDSSKLLIDNLINISPNKKRVPLSQRLKSIALRSYDCEDIEDIENIEYIDNESNENPIANIATRNEEKSNSRHNSRHNLQTIKEPEYSLTDSQTKKRNLNERLNQIARSYYPSSDLENEFNSELNKSDVKSDNDERKSSLSDSPLKKKILLTDNNNDNKSSELKTDSIQSKTTTNVSPIKKLLVSTDKRLDNEWKSSQNETNAKVSESCSSNPRKNLFKESPVKKPIEKSTEEILKNQNYQKVVEKPNKLIFNCNNNREISNVSTVIQQFESKPKAEKPETLSLRAKTDLFEKAILAENEAKSKQYIRKRMAATVKPILNQNCNTLKTNKIMESMNATNDEILTKKPKNDKSSPTKMVSNNILLRKQLLEERLFSAESSTASSVIKDVENRKKELELLKRPFKPIKDTAEEDSTNNIEIQNIREQNEEEQVLSDQIDYNDNNENDDSIVDSETAHQTVCEAFEEIEDYSTEQSEDDLFDENINKDIPTQKSNTSLSIDFAYNKLSESPTKKNRLYPELISIEESNQILLASSSSLVSPPPEKPPRTSGQSYGSETPLRTISFYRREQKQKNTISATETVSVKQKEKENKFDIEDRNIKIQGRIDQLREEIEQHNRIAGQASQALNLCLETNEFKGSTEHVEAERLLLVSAQKRIAALNEIQKLKVALTETTYDRNMTKGCLSLFNVQLPIKGEFLVSRAKGNVTDIHNLVCLIYNGANVIVTDLLNTEKDIKNGILDFSCGVYLSELPNDFQIVVQVYDFITSKHQLPHDIKYHIKRTPKKSKSGSMKSPTVRSPGGPNAVLSTSFSLVGKANINLSNYKKRSYTLENFCYTCPLEGLLTAKIELKVEHNYNREGFFDIRDENGFWNLRWIVLRGHQLAFWRFPEDVNKKSSLGSIDLKQCINPKVSLLESHLKQVCIRPNTFGLITIANTPKNVFTKGGTIHKSHPIKYLISAETKSDCIEWCEQLTKILDNIRLWDCDASTPYTTQEFERLLMSLN